MTTNLQLIVTWVKVKFLPGGFILATVSVSSFWEEK